MRRVTEEGGVREEFASPVKHASTVCPRLGSRFLSSVSLTKWLQVWEVFSLSFSRAWGNWDNFGWENWASTSVSWTFCFKQVQLKIIFQVVSIITTKTIAWKNSIIFLLLSNYNQSFFQLVLRLLLIISPVSAWTLGQLYCSMKSRIISCLAL